MTKNNLQFDYSEIIISSESPDHYSTKRLLEEARNQKISASYVNPYKNTLIFSPKSSHNKHSKTVCFHRTTGIRYDDHDLTVSQYYQYLGHQVTNPLNSLIKFRNKDTQSIFMLENKITTIPTISMRGQLNEESIEKIISLSKDQTYILKMNRGNQGIGVSYIQSPISLKSILETFHAINDQKFIIQPFISHKKELRIFIIKNEMISIVEKTISKDDFRGNAKRSKARIIKKIPKELEEDIFKISKNSGLDYCGIDVLLSEKSHYILEVNAVPGFRQIEELSHINIAKELITSFF